MCLKHRKGNLICIDGNVSFQKEVEWASFMFNWKCSGNIQSLQIPLIWQFEFSNSKRLIWSPFQLDICQKGKGLGVFRPFSMELLTQKNKVLVFCLDRFMLDQWPLLLWTLCRHSWNIMETSCPTICISNQIPSIYITVKAVRHLAGTPNLFDFATYRLCATSTSSSWVVSYMHCNAVREAINHVFLKREDDDSNGWALMKMLMLSGLCSNRRKWCWGSSPRPPLTIKLDTQRVLQTRCQKRHPILSLFYSTRTS